MRQAARHPKPTARVPSRALTRGDGGEPLNHCREPGEVDAAIDRGEEHAGVALIALVHNNPDTDPGPAQGCPEVALIESGDPPAESPCSDAHRPAPRPRDAIAVELLLGLLQPLRRLNCAARPQRGPQQGWRVWSSFGKPRQWSPLVRRSGGQVAGARQLWNSSSDPNSVTAVTIRNAIAASNGICSDSQDHRR